MRNANTCALYLAAALFLPCPRSGLAQVPTALDQVSITPPNYKVPHFLEGSRDTLAAAHITLIDLTRIEYHYSPEHITGLTAEQRNTRFDVVARIDPAGVLDPEHDSHANSFMIDALLKNDFRLVVHETDKPFEQLIVPSGKKVGACPPPDSPSTTGSSNPIAGQCITMDEFASQLSNEFHIEVVNGTNLPGTFPIGFYRPLVASNARGIRLTQSLQVALSADLGLMLIHGQNQGKDLVVDHVEFPAIIELTKTATAN